MHAAARSSDLVGNTPFLDLSSLLEGAAPGSKLYGKLESLGPCSSVKDQIGTRINRSSNTGLVMPRPARERGYRCVLTMPETMSVERRMMLLALGAEVVTGSVRTFLGFEAGFRGRFITLGFIKRRWKQTRDVLALSNIFP
jgi:cysteine synthase